MIVCVCSNVSDKKIKSLIQEQGYEKIHLIKKIKEHIDVCNQCGKCKNDLKKIIHEFSPPHSKK